MKIAITGATGLIGSRFLDLAKSRYEIIPISTSFGIDITDRKKIHKFLSSKNPAVIFHFAAKTNVDICEEDREADIKKLRKEKAYKEDSGLDFENLNVDEWKGSESAFGVNVVGTKNLADFAAKNDTKFVYLSTDFVFDGESNTEYTEESAPAPSNWYGQTKLWGEKTLPASSIIARIAYPYGHRSLIKRDLVWTLISLLLEKETVSLVNDQIITPTFIDDIIMALDFLIEKRFEGLINVVGNNFLSPYEIGIIIARELGIEEAKIEHTTREKLYKGRATRPFKVKLKNDKLKNLGFAMTDFIDVIRQIKKDLI